VTDYFRDAADRSHFGRFVGSIVDGGAADTVLRKLRTSLDLLLAGPHTLAALVGSVLGAVAVFRPPTALRRAYRDHPALRPGLVATVVLCAVGFATNDSSVAVPAVAALVTLPATLAICAAAARPPDGAGRSVRAGTGDTGDPGGAERAGGADAPAGPDTPTPETGHRAEVLP
jgi:hypothetical protein